MKEHHRAAVHNLIELLKDKEEFLAIILAGSIAKGTSKDGSDIDVYLVVTDEEFARRSAKADLFYFNNEICGYPGGYIDGKIIRADFLKQAALKGSEPTRASFIGSTVVFSRLPGLESVIARIPVYPEANRDRNLLDFFAQVLLYGRYFAIQALDQGNTYMRSHAVSNLVLFASRMILAHNRILFPCHKSLMNAVEEAANKPDHFIDMAEDLMNRPTKEKVTAFVDTISSFRNWGITYAQAVSIFVENNEWNWIAQEPPLQDR